MVSVVCVDCIREGVTRYRPTPHGGAKSPLCMTHYRARCRRRRDRGHELRTQKNYGLTRREYLALYEAQGGVCFICRVATGAVKRLAVDHDHHMEGCTHAPEVGCHRCVRALLCGPCNQTIGRWNAKKLARAIAVLTCPPARAVLSQLDA